jgi:hypothetical protein
MGLVSVASMSAFSRVANQPPNYIIKKVKFGVKQDMWARRG